MQQARDATEEVAASSVEAAGDAAAVEPGIDASVVEPESEPAESAPPLRKSCILIVLLKER